MGWGRNDVAPFEADMCSYAEQLNQSMAIGKYISCKGLTSVLAMYLGRNEVAAYAGVVATSDAYSYVGKALVLCHHHHSQGSDT